MRDFPWGFSYAIAQKQHAKLITIVGNAACFMQLMTCSSVCVVCVCMCVWHKVSKRESMGSMDSMGPWDLRARVEELKALEHYRWSGRGRAIVLA